MDWRKPLHLSKSLFLGNLLAENRISYTYEPHFASGACVYGWAGLDVTTGDRWIISPALMASHNHIVLEA